MVLKIKTIPSFERGEHVEYKYIFSTAYMDQSTIQKAYVLQYSNIIILSLEVMCTQFIDLTIYNKYDR